MNLRRLWVGLLVGLLGLGPTAFAELPPPEDFPGALVNYENPPKELKELNGILSQEAAFQARFLLSVYKLGIERPVNSEGRVVFDVDKGLLWQTLSPYKEALWVSQEGVFQLSSQGKERIGDDPGFYRKIQEFSQGSMAKLGSEAALYFGAKDDLWEIKVVPQSGVLAANVAEFRIRGSRGVIYWVRLALRDKTVMSIRLADFQRYKQSLGETEFFFLEPRRDFVP